MKSLRYTPGVKPANKNTFVQQVHEAVTYVMRNDRNNVFQNLNTNNRTVNIYMSTSTDPNVANRTVPQGTYNSSTGALVSASADIH